MIHHQQATTVKPVTPQIKKTEWVRVGLVVKIKAEGKYQRVKGEVTKVLSSDRVTVRLQSDNSEREFKERDVSKVLPSEGGRVYIFSNN